MLEQIEVMCSQKGPSGLGPAAHLLSLLQDRSALSDLIARHQRHLQPAGISNTASDEGQADEACLGGRAGLAGSEWGVLCWTP